MAVLYSIIDMGTQEIEWAGEKKKSRRLRLTWEFPKKRYDFDGQSKPLVISKDTAFSMFAKSSLRPIVEAMIGKSLTDKEADDFDVSSICGMGCLAAVVHKKGTDGIVRAKLGGVQPLMDGMEAPKPENTPVIYSVEDGITEEFSKLPEWLKEKLVKAPEFGTNDTQEKEGDEIPF